MPYYSNPITSSAQKMVINLLKSLQQNLQIFMVNKFKHLVKVKKITIDLTNPYFMSATFRTCFFSPFSNLNDEKVTLRLIEVQV